MLICKYSSPFFTIQVKITLMIKWSAVDCGFKRRKGQTNNYENSIFCFSIKHAALRSKKKDWLGRYQHNVCEWSIMSIDVVSVS